MNDEKENFQKDISDLLMTMSKVCSEKDFRKAYREMYGHNINQKIDSLDAGNVYNFLRFQCRTICDVYRNDGEVKIQKISNENSSPPDSKQQKKKNKKSNSAPKLNFPRVGVLNETSFPRRNPQGFNKTKPPQKEEKTLTSLSLFTPNVYRPVDQLKNFQIEDEDDDSETGNIHALAPTVRYCGTGASPVFEEIEYDEIQCLEAKTVPWSCTIEQKSPPCVLDQSAFPSLGNQKAENGIAKDEPEETTEITLQTQSSVTELSEEIRKMFSQPAPKICQLSIFDLDDEIFRALLPDVVDDPSYKVPMPKIHMLIQKVLFEVKLVLIASPHEFYFQYGFPCLNLLMVRIKEFYDVSSHDLVMSPLTMKLGLIVVAQIDGIWYRAEINKEPKRENGMLKVFLLDYGTFERVHYANIRYIIKKFARDPVKALRGYLIGIKPKYNEINWNYQSKSSFFDAVANKLLYASIRFYRKDNDVYEIELTDKINTTYFDVAKLVIQRGLADHQELFENYPYALPLAIPRTDMLRA